MGKRGPILALVAALWAMATLPLIGAEPLSGPRQYQVNIRLVDKMPDGQVRVLCEPVLAITENRPATYNNGGTTEPPDGIDLRESLRQGTELNILLFRNKGRLFVDMKCSATDSSHADSQGVRLVTSGVRVIESVKLGKIIVVAVSYGQQMRWELLVRELPSDLKRPLPWPENQQSRKEEPDK